MRQIRSVKVVILTEITHDFVIFDLSMMRSNMELRVSEGAFLKDKVILHK